MRSLPLCLLCLALAACAGNVADYVGPRGSIVAPELTRYGLNLRESRCVGEQLGSSLTPLQLRRLVRAAGSVRQGYYDPDQLTARDLLHVANSMPDGQVRPALQSAIGACGVSIVDRVAAARPAPADAAARAAAPRPPAWLSLGTAPSGQAIAIDASTLKSDGQAREGWIRLINPGEPPPGNSYLLRVDCSGRTITSVARRRQDASGAVTEYREYPDNPLPVEAGTVMEIAFLSLCT